MNYNYNEEAELVEKTLNGRLTTNKHGYMMKIDDPNLVECMNLIDKSKRVGDFGVAFGHSTRRLLENGFNVVANDLDPQMLDHLYASVSEKERTRLQLVPGDVTKLEFEENSFGAIFAFRWMHFLRGDVFRQMIEKYYKWLAPGGLLCISCVEGVLLNKKESICQFEYLNDDPEWPGHAKFVPTNSLIDRITPEFVHLVSPNILAREVSRAGFYIYKSMLFIVFFF